jgi:hypothetical protein
MRSCLLAIAMLVPVTAVEACPLQVQANVGYYTQPVYAQQVVQPVYEVQQVQQVQQYVAPVEQVQVQRYYAPQQVIQRNVAVNAYAYTQPVGVAAVRVRTPILGQRRLNKANRIQVRAAVRGNAAVVAPVVGY